MKKRGFTHHIRRLKGIRKTKEKLPPWKNSWNNFNEKHFHWLERIVDVLIPFLVLLLLIIILGEFAHYLPFAWGQKISDFFHNYGSQVKVLDQIIISFFIVDLYFNFFKKRTVWKFIQTSFLDIIAIAPLAAIFDAFGLAEMQRVLHVEQETAKILKEGELTGKLLRTEQFAKFARVRRTTRIIRAIARIPRFFRLHRIKDFFKK